MVQNSKAKPQNDMNKYQQRLQIWGHVFMRTKQYIPLQST